MARKTGALCGCPLPRARAVGLVWYEVYDRVDEAIAREKDVNKRRPAWKIRLIEEMNPEWQDLYETLNA
jgi:putative endonuclease